MATERLPSLPISNLNSNLPQTIILNNDNMSVKNQKVTDFSITNILKQDPTISDSKNARQNLRKRVQPLNEHISSPWVCWAPLFYNNNKITQQIVTNLSKFENSVNVVTSNYDKYYGDLYKFDSYPANNLREYNKVQAADLNEFNIPKRSVEKEEVLNFPPIADIKLEENQSGATCNVCQKVFADEQLLKVHANTHVSRYYCEECDKGFSQLRNFRYHISVHRGTGEFRATCPECGKTFNDRGYLSSHMKIHRNRKEYACPHCPKCFNQRVAYNMHVRIHTGVKPHKCVECGKCFSRKMLLRQHARTHSGEKPYQCPQCHKPFADRSNMTLHLKLHSGIKPFSCPICPKAFSKKHHLKTHMNYHTGSKPYMCPYKDCGQRFSQSSNMRTHAKKCPCAGNIL